MKKTLSAALGLLMALLLVAVSCEGNGAVPGQASSRDLVTVSFSKLVAKGIENFTVGTVNTPELGSVYFQYRAVKDESDPNPGLTIGAKTEWTDLVTGDNREPGLAHTIQLCRGTWNITLRGFASDEARLAAGVKETGDEDVRAIFEGASERSEIGGNLSERSQTVDVTLGFTNPAGSGRYTIAVSLPQNHASQNGQVRVTVRDSGNAEQTATKTYGAESLSENFEFDNVPNGIATVKVEYLTPDGATVLGSGEGTTLIMTDMHTSGTATVAEDDTYEVRFTVNNAVGSPEGIFMPTTFTSLFEIYPDTIADNEIVVGYAYEAKALDVTPISFPAEILTGDAVKDEKGRYKASELGLVPVTVTTSSDLNASGATEAWWGKTAAVGFSATENTTLASVQFVDGVTSIGDYAFRKCTGLTSVTIPDGVTSIESSAFRDCTGLTSITIPEGVTSIRIYTFNGCNGLTSITLPSSVTLIESYAFQNCTGLTSITIPDGVTLIGSQAFKSCKGLTSITLPSSVTSIESSAFQDCTGLTSVTIPEGVTSIGSQAFYGCTSLTEVTYGGTVEQWYEVGYSFGYATDITCKNGEKVLFLIRTSSGEIQKKSLYELTPYAKSNYTEITIPDGVTEISGGFRAWKELTSVTFPETVTVIGNGVFEMCSGLTNITIPNNLQIIGSAGFRSCLGLKGNITLPENLTRIDDFAFESCNEITSITIGNKVASLGEGVFAQCKKLESINVAEGNSNYTSVDGVLFTSDMTTLVAYPMVTANSYEIPSGITEITGYTFKGCEGLKNITIPSSVTSIGGWAFYGCKGLTSITIPEGVTTIGNWAFYGCTGLTDIYVNQPESTLLDKASVPLGCKIHWNSAGPGNP